VEVYFKNIEKHLIRHIDAADVVIGCVAWLTNWTILEALSKKRGVSIIVQKEDFLRPDDAGSRAAWNTRLRAAYDKLPATLDRYDSGFVGTVLGGMSRGADLSISAVRCVGNYNSEKVPASPKSHHKFVVFARSEWGMSSPYEDTRLMFVPYAVWTGSFNFTQNAVRSFENAVLMTDEKVVRAYLSEYAQVAA
jgi:hypothetical protein